MCMPILIVNFVYSNCSTVNIGCNAGMKLRLSDDCQSLTVTKVLEEHNHEVDKVC